MSSQPNLTLNTVIAHGEMQVSTVVDGETVLMSVDNGKYYKLDRVGSRIWALIEEPATVGSLCERLVQEFEVEQATCEADVLMLLNRLLENALIREVQPADASLSAS